MTPAPLSLRAFGHRVLVALLISGVILAALAVAVIRTENKKVDSIAVAPIDPSLLRAGGNYLIIGSDTRAFAESKEDLEHFGSAQEIGNARSDTMMVAHIDPGKHTGVLVSIPRDLWVSIPEHGESKINAAFAYGGAQLAIRTLQQNFDIPISHYLEVDFAGFRDIVDAIGSVPIHFPTPARDHNTGLLIQTPGCHNLNGSDALAYVRSRYYEYQSNGKWRYDPTSDLGRINRQQYFIRSLSKAAIHSVVSRPFRIGDVVDKSVKSLTRDKALSTSDLKKLVRAFRNTDPNAFPMYTLPATNGFRNSQSVLLLDEAKAAPTLARLRPVNPEASKPPPNISPGTVLIAVQNGSGTTGAARRTLDALTAAGFKSAGPAADADRSDYAVTEVRYAPGAEDKARLVLSRLGGAGKLVAMDSEPGGVDVIVVLGDDFHGTATATAPTAAPITVAPAPTARRPAGGGSTTTTGPPANPGGAMPVAGC